jgi:hypothetical protein
LRRLQRDRSCERLARRWFDGFARQWRKQMDEQIIELMTTGCCVTRIAEDTTGSGNGLTVEVIRDAKRKLLALDDSKPHGNCDCMSCRPWTY